MADTFGAFLAFDFSVNSHTIYLFTISKNEESMWKRTTSKVYQDVKKEAVWSILTDVNKWATWHGDLDSCTMEGPFKAGNHFMLKPKGMSAVKIVLTDVQPDAQFTDCTTFFGAKMPHTFLLEETSEGLRITSTLVVTGWLSWLWIKLVAQHVADSVKEEMDAAVVLAREKHV